MTGDASVQTNTQRIQGIRVGDVFAQLESSLELSWLTPAIGSDAVIGSIRREGRRIPVVGYLNFIHPPQVQVIGEPEAAYLETIDAAQHAHVRERLGAGATRLVVVADNQVLDYALHDALTKAGVAIFHTPATGHRAAYRLRHFLGEMLARQTTIHGVFVEVLSIGLLLTGEPGIGKSELALELINRGHRLVADDAPEFVLLGPDDLNGRCPPLLQDFLEVRGLGILNIRAMFGEAAMKRRKQLGLIIRMARPDARTTPPPDRLVGTRTRRDILGVAIPEITLPVTVGQNLSVLVEAACRDHLLRMQGQNSDEQFARRQQAAMYDDPGDAGIPARMAPDEPGPEMYEGGA